MRISYYTVEGNTDVTKGYGNAGYNVVTSLQRLGHEVPFDDPTAPVQISFCNPMGYKFHPGQYKIGYTPWESTELPDGWLERMNACDEIWATSAWTADVFAKAGVTVPIYVYMHGLNKKWKPIKREKSDRVRFLHIGEPALRKGGQMALDAFRAVFGDRDDVHLTMKCYYQHYLRSWQDGNFGIPRYDNVTILTENLSEPELMNLYASHDVLVYPSYGEGFGLIPLQALGTGMPVICTEEWAPYRGYLWPLGLRSRYERSIWSIHPGKMTYPDYEDLKSLYKTAYESIDDLKAGFYAQAEQVAADFDWDELTRDAFTRIEKMFTEK